MISLRFSLV